MDHIESISPNSKESMPEHIETHWSPSQSFPPPPFYEQFADVSPQSPDHEHFWYNEQPMRDHRASSKQAEIHENEQAGREYRASSKQAGVSADPLQSPGLESIWSGEGDKEVFPSQPAVEPDAKRTKTADVEQQGEPEKSRWTSRACVIGAVCLSILLGIGLGLGLGLGLSKKHHSNNPQQEANLLSSTYNIGGALNPEFYSHTGAFNGSGIALASESFDGTTHGDLVMYFQHWTGQIRWMELDDEGAWVGGDITTVVASDAKNNTPLSAVAYALEQTSTWHVFYIDTDNILRQKSNSNVTNVWTEGPLSSQNITIYDSDQVGMQACWYGNDYGDSDYLHTPLPSNDNSTSNTTTSSSQEVGMHMWYASDNQTFQQLGWRDGDTNWTYQNTWTGKDGHAGVGCYSWGAGSVTYVMMVNLENTVEFWWKDTNTSLTSTTDHPINEWVNSSIAINNVQPSTSLGYTNIFYAQNANTDSILGYNISWAAENTTIGGIFTVDGTKGLPGTHMSVTAEPSASGGNELYVFYQTNGTDITEFSRDFVSGQWFEYGLSIPSS